MPDRGRARSLAAIWGSVVVAPVATAAALGWFLLAHQATPSQTSAPTPDEPVRLTEVESPYNDISIWKRADRNLMLLFGARRLHYVESIVDPADPLDLPATYTQSMVTGALAFPTHLDSAMIIGLGGGRTSWYLHKSVPSLDYTAVELEPDVIRLCAQYFGVAAEPNFSIVN